MIQRKVSVSAFVIEVTEENKLMAIRNVRIENIYSSKNCLIWNTKAMMVGKPAHLSPNQWFASKISVTLSGVEHSVSCF